MARINVCLFSALVLVTAACATAPNEAAVLNANPARSEGVARLGPGSHGLSKIEKNGFVFETDMSAPSRLVLRNNTRMALLHDDKDDADKHVRFLLEQAVFTVKAAHPNVVIVERRSIKDLLTEFKFQSSGLVRDQDLAKIGHFIGLDYVIVFDTSYADLNELYGLNNRIDAWEVVIQTKIIDVNTAELVFSCSPTTRVAVGKTMKASEVKTLNREALAVAAKSASLCLTRSLDGSPTRD